MSLKIINNQKFLIDFLKDAIKDIKARFHVPKNVFSEIHCFYLQQEGKGFILTCSSKSTKLA